MTISFEFPADIEANLRRDLGDLDLATKEAALVELFREQKITQHELARALGMTRFETEAVLKNHHVTEDFPNDEEIQRALARLEELRPTC